MHTYFSLLSFFNKFTPANHIAQLKGLYVQNFIAELGHFHQYCVKKHLGLHPHHISSMLYKKQDTM